MQPLEKGRAKGGGWTRLEEAGLVSIPADGNTGLFKSEERRANRAIPGVKANRTYAAPGNASQSHLG